MSPSRIPLWVLAFVGAAICLATSLFFATSQPEPLWPLPGLYLFETALLGLAAFLAIVWGDPSPRSNSSLVLWGSVGALLGLAVLGAWSLGPFLTPAVLTFGLAGFLRTTRRSGGFGRSIGILLSAAVVQAALIVGILLMGG